MRVVGLLVSFRVYVWVCGAKKIHRYRNRHVCCRPLREKKDPKRQRPAEVNTVLAIAGDDSRIEISTLTDDQNAPHTAKVNVLLNVDKFGVVEVVDRNRNKFYRHAGYQNRDWMDHTK